MVNLRKEDLLLHRQAGRSDVNEVVTGRQLAHVPMYDHAVWLSCVAEMQGLFSREPFTVSITSSTSTSELLIPRLAECAAHNETHPAARGMKPSWGCLHLMLDAGCTI